MSETVLLVGQFKPAALVPIPVQLGQVDLEVLVLNKCESTIGRDSSCDHSIVSMEVSRKHAVIKYENDAWWIHDLRSTNGLLVQGIKLAPGEIRRLEDRCSVCFGPADKGHFKYIFHENYTQLEGSQTNAKPSSPLAYVDPSGYDSMATQDLNSNRSSPLEQSHQVELYRSEIIRLKVKTAELEMQLKQQKDHNRLISSDVRMTQRMLTERESKYNKKIDNLKSMMNKYRTLIGQLESSQSQSSRCMSSDDESGNERACTETLFGGGKNSAVSSVLHEVTCSICSEYLVLPTSLNCQHVFCLHCIDAWKQEYRSKYNSVSNGICPVCRKEVQFQTQPLAFENLINILLENVLDRSKLEERRKLVEARKKKPLASSDSNSPSMNSSSLGSFLSQLLNGIPRSRRSSIVIASDESDDGELEPDDDDYDSLDVDDDVVEIDYNEESGEVEVNLELSDADGDEEIDISITLTSSGADLQQVLDAQDSDDEILMIEDDDSNPNQSGVLYYLDDSESAPEPILISDSEEEPPTNARRRRRRPSIILSDNEDSISGLFSAASSSNSSGASGRRRRNDRRPSNFTRAHPYRRPGHSNIGNNSTTIAANH